MSVAAWILAIPQFIMVALSFYLAIQNHCLAIKLRESQPDLSAKMAKCFAGAIFVIVAYVPATVGWLLEQHIEYIPSISTVATFIWDFCVFLCIYEWLKFSNQIMSKENNKQACRSCPLRDDPYSREECQQCH